MTINQMMIFSYIFLGMLFCFLIASGIVFVRLDVRRAWRILAGKPQRIIRKEPIRTKHILTQPLDATEVLNIRRDIQERDDSTTVDIIFIDTQVTL